MSRRDSFRQLSRRKFGIVSAAPFAATAAAQQSPRTTESPLTPPQRTVSPAIAGFPVPMSTEPGFIFKP
jgi:hypothetical protein